MSNAPWRVTGDGVVYLGDVARGAATPKGIYCMVWFPLVGSLAVVRSCSFFRGDIYDEALGMCVARYYTMPVCRC